MSSFKLNKKKSRLQMHRAEEERKRLEAAAEVEAVYADFVDSFDVDDPGDKAFVRAGTMEGGKFSQSGEPESKKRYVPGGGSSSSTKKKKGGGFGGIDLSAMGGVAKKTKKGKEPSQRELFLQEMKREQQDRDARLAGRKAGGGKFAMGDRPPGGGSLFDVAPPLDAGEDFALSAPTLRDCPAAAIMDGGIVGWLCTDCGLPAVSVRFGRPAMPIDCGPQSACFRAYSIVGQEETTTTCLAKRPGSTMPNAS